MEMADEDLISRIRDRANDSKRQNSSRAPTRDRTLLPCPPATLESLRQAEEQMGFALPPLLERLYLEVGNGGFGPGFGLYGISGGFAEDLQGLTLPDLYISETGYDGWPNKLVSICDWGCTMGCAIDCSAPKGEMVFVGGPGELFQSEGITFAQWMEDWVNGVDLFTRAHDRRTPRLAP